MATSCYHARRWAHYFWFSQPPRHTYPLQARSQRRHQDIITFLFSGRCAYNTFMPSLFTKIIQWEIPSYRVYEDNLLYAFLTIEPHRLGHTLVVPKMEIGDILDLPDDIYIHMMDVSKNILSPALKKATLALRIWFLIEGFGITDHAHLHLIPLMESGDMNTAMAHTETPENMTLIAEKIRSYFL